MEWYINGTITAQGSSNIVTANLIQQRNEFLGSQEQYANHQHNLEQLWQEVMHPAQAN